MKEINVNIDDLIKCGAGDYEIQMVESKLNSDGFVKASETWLDIDVFTLFSLIDMKRGTSIKRKFFADCCMLDEDYAMIYARDPIEQKKLRMQIADPMGFHGGCIESLATINIKRYRSESDLIGRGIIDDEHEKSLVVSLKKIKELLAVIFFECDSSQEFGLNGDIRVCNNCGKSQTYL